MINKLKDLNGNITSGPAVIANILDKFFVNVSRGITRNIWTSLSSLLWS